MQWGKFRRLICRGTGNALNVRGNNVHTYIIYVYISAHVGWCAMHKMRPAVGLSITYSLSRPRDLDYLGACDVQTMLYNVVGGAWTD